MTIWRLSAAAAAMLTMTGAAVAQEAAVSLESITVFGKRPVYRAETVSSATKTDTALIDVPQSISVVTSDLIEDQAMRSMADVVRYAPGVTMGQGEGHRDAPTLRGNSTTADFFVDGVRDDVQYFRDLYNAERIEILKGPNAMIFGRGGGGGVINRVTEWATWTPHLEFDAQAGSFEQARVGIDANLAREGGTLAGRINTFYENSGSYRDFVDVERYGVNPTGAAQLGPDTELRVGYEYFFDDRTVDRGVPSQNGRPFAGSRSAFFGNPDQSFSKAEINSASATLDHAFSSDFSVRAHLVAADYAKYYANVHANSAVAANGDVSLQSYFSGTDRTNLFSQTDFTWRAKTGSINHTVLFGFEFGHQETDNTRAPNNNAAGVVNIAAPTIFTPVAFTLPLQTDNRVDLDVAAGYVQDQIALTERVIVVAGLRFDRFDLSFDDRRAGRPDFARTDEFVSPRLGLIYKPVPDASLYASYAVSSLPQSGEQFASLTATTAALEPEEFESLEVGVKWAPLEDLSLGAAVYRLDRTNAAAIDPLTNLTVLTGAQRSEGVELEVSGAITPRWRVVGGYAYQEAEITRTTTAAPAGRRVALTPEHAASLWNAVELTDRVGFGLGLIYQGESFASISNAVVLPSFTRVDAALYLDLTEALEIQLNIENLLDETYWATAHNDNNITPGSPTAARVSLKARF